MAGSSPFFTRVGYRCVYRAWDPERGLWVIRRHRFTQRSADDPLPRRHPTHAHAYSSDACPVCELTYAPDDGPRAGRGFVFATTEIADVLVSVGQRHPIREAIAQARRDALRFRAPTRSHRRFAEPDNTRPATDDPPSEDEAWPVDLAEPLVEEPEWLAAWPLEEAPELVARRHRTHVVPAALTDPAAMVGQERYLSRSGATGAEYVDVFAPVVTAPYRRDIWPDVMVLDSQPLRRRTLVTSDERARVASDFLCEIVGALDGTTKELIALYPAGGKDQESLKELFAAKKGAPSWIVTDVDPALAAAIADAFPEAIHYRCEDHLRKDAEELAAADGIEDHDVLVALHAAQRSPEAWASFTALVDARVPADRTRLRDWISRSRDLVLGQCALRARHPGRPRSTGGLEAHLTAVRSTFEFRRFSLRNRERLAKVLELIRVERTHQARPEQYRLLVRRHLEARRDGAIEWRRHWDPLVPDEDGHLTLGSSLIAFRDAARARNRAARYEGIVADAAARKAQQFDEAIARAIEAGGSPQGRARRSSPRATVSRRGDSVADVPEMLALWDHERNSGVDPAGVRAHSRTEYWWICRGHEAGDPEGRWPGHLHRWQQAPARRVSRSPGCRFCMRREACPATCLRVTHPHLAEPAEWDYAANDAAGVTPDTVLSGSREEVSWRCEAHGPYRMAVQLRAHDGQGCRVCAREAAERKRQETLRARRRERYAEGRQAARRDG